MRVERTDVLIIGSGAAGMLAAIEASPDCGVTLVCKGPFGRDGATIAAQADIAVDGRTCRALLGLDADDSDSPELLASDMLIEGGYLGDEELIAIQSESVGREVSALVERGLVLRGLVHNPGHSKPRSVWISARELASILRRDVTKAGVAVREYTMACELILDEGEVLGALLLDRVSCELYAVLARVTVIAAGGGMQLYPYSTAPSGLTGDGLAMALRAGAELSDMEFPMFLPYTLIEPKILRGVTFTHDLAMLTEAHALNRSGERFMKRWDPVRMERSTRDVNAAAAGLEIAEGRGSRAGGIWLSLTHLPANLIEEMGDWLPEGLSGWKYGGFDLKALLPDLSREALQTAPASHFWNGGIVVDAGCRTRVANLFAAGEGIAGLNGANRISGNGLAQAVVWGARAGRFAAAHTSRSGPVRDIGDGRIEEVAAPFREASARRDGCSPIELTGRIRSEAWRGIGLVRDEKGLRAFMDFIDEIRGLLHTQAAFQEVWGWNEKLVASIENRNLADVASATATAALVRCESRGSHYRKDFPDTDEAWNVNVSLRIEGGRMASEAKAARNSHARVHRAGRHGYGDKRRYSDESKDQGQKRS